MVYILASRSAEPQQASSCSSFEDVFKANAPRLRALANRRLPGRGVADDVVQETFLRAYRAAGSFDGDRPVWPWLKAIANNVCTDMLRDARTWRECPQECPMEDVDLRSSAADPADMFLGAEKRRSIAEALATMNPRQRRVLLLRDLEGWRTEDVARLDASSVDAVKSTLKRGRSTFRSAYVAAASARGLLGTAIGIGGFVVERARSVGRRAARLSEAPASALAGPFQLLSASAGIVFVAVTGAVAIAGVSAGVLMTDSTPASQSTPVPPSSASGADGGTGDGAVVGGGGTPGSAVAPSRSSIVAVQASDLAPEPAALGVDGGVETAAEGDSLIATVLARTPEDEQAQPVFEGFSDLNCDYSTARQAACDAIASPLPPAGG